VRGDIELGRRLTNALVAVALFDLELLQPPKWTMSQRLQPFDCAQGSSQRCAIYGHFTKPQTLAAITERKA